MAKQRKADTNKVVTNIKLNPNNFPIHNINRDIIWIAPRIKEALNNDNYESLREMIGDNINAVDANGKTLERIAQDLDSPKLLDYLYQNGYEFGINIAPAGETPIYQWAFILNSDKFRKEISNAINNSNSIEDIKLEYVDGINGPAHCASSSKVDSASWYVGKEKEWNILNTNKSCISNTIYSESAPGNSRDVLDFTLGAFLKKSGTGKNAKHTVDLNKMLPFVLELIEDLNINSEYEILKKVAKSESMPDSIDPEIKDLISSTMFLKMQEFTGYFNHSGSCKNISEVIQSLKGNIDKPWGKIHYEVDVLKAQHITEEHWGVTYKDEGTNQDISVSYHVLKGVIDGFSKFIGRHKHDTYADLNKNCSSIAQKFGLSDIIENDIPQVEIIIDEFSRNEEFKSDVEVVGDNTITPMDLDA